jgi:pyruvate dehydrogenase E1 component
MSEVLRAQALLEKLGVSADIWSVTSYNELCREALRVERSSLLAGGGGTDQPARPWVQELLAGETGVFVAASDYMKALPLSISRWVPGPYVVLGTDGYGLSESRPELRNWFEVSAEYVAWAAMAALREQGVVSGQELAKAGRTLGIDPEKANPADFGPADREPTERDPSGS